MSWMAGICHTSKLRNLQTKAIVDIGVLDYLNNSDILIKN